MTSPTKTPVRSNTHTLGRFPRIGLGYIFGNNQFRGNHMFDLYGRTSQAVHPRVPVEAYRAASVLSYSKLSYAVNRERRMSAESIRRPVTQYRKPDYPSELREAA